MHKDRLVAFSDGVFAILITIMVLSLKVPQGHELLELYAVFPVFVSYAVSFIYVGIYWNNHHHLFHAVQRVSGATLWANSHLLFWLSLLPFATEWAGHSQFAGAPLALYGAILFMCSVAYSILIRVLIANHEKDSLLTRAIGSDTKGNISVVLNLLGIGLAFVLPWAACLIYLTIAVIWLVPDSRIEKRI